MFLGTVRAYRKKSGWDYGLEEVCWAQPLSDNPQPVLALPIPQTRQEAERLIGSRMMIHQQFSDRYPLETCNDWGIRLKGWTEHTPGHIEALVKEGWCNPSPLADPGYYEARSPAFKEISEYYRQGVQMDLCLIATLINGGILQNVPGMGA